MSSEPWNKYGRIEQLHIIFVILFIRFFAYVFCLFFRGGHTFQEAYYINKKKQTESDFGLTKCYIFDSAANYLNFLLLNLIQLNPNICLCQNCGELFVAKTKKKTLYCDRIQPDSNKTCSEIGPKNRAELQSTLFGFEDYGKAVERNYQRAKRTEEYYVKDI